MKRSSSTHQFTKPTGLTLVLKVGTSSLINNDHQAINLTNLARIVETVRDLMAAGHRVVIVTSGAVGAGAARLRLATRPTDLAAKQALAAVGQVHLMRYYDDFCGALGLTAAQVLLTLDNLAVRSQYLTAAAAFGALFEAGAVPIVNENDTVAVQELRIGDNDTLAAQVATLVHADWLFLLTDVDALYTANPAADPRAAPVREVHDVAALAGAVSTGGAVGGTAWGTGGMATKLTAARIATAAGCSTAVVHGAAPGRVARVLAGDAAAGTVFHATPTPTRGRKRWITSVPVKGELHLDPGAVAAVRARGTSLFAAGVARVVGGFGPLDAVSLIAADSGAELARGLVNYGSEDVEKLVADARKGKERGGGGGGRERRRRRARHLLLRRRRAVPVRRAGVARPRRTGAPGQHRPAGPARDDADASRVRHAPGDGGPAVRRRRGRRGRGGRGAPASPVHPAAAVGGRAPAAADVAARAARRRRARSAASPPARAGRRPGRGRGQARVV